MRKGLALLAAAAALGATGAIAHPGPKLLTAGPAKEKTAMTPGMTFEDINGVHVFRSAKKPAAALAGAGLLSHSMNIEVAIEKRVWRAFRPMRTQGFYTGRGPKSRRYTQGFYSGD